MERETLASYALGALEAAEVSFLERHVEDCEACREYLRWLQPAIDLLPGSVDQLRPSPRVRAAVLAEVRADARGAKGASRLRFLRPGMALRPAAGLAALALVAAATAGYVLRGSGGATHSTIAAVPTGSVSATRVEASLERVDGSATLVVGSMPRLPGNRVYEVWAKRGDQMVPESTFVLRRDGTANAAVPGLEGASAVLVTQEPRGGSDAPTTKPLLRVALD